MKTILELLEEQAGEGIGIIRITVNGMTSPVEHLSVLSGGEVIYARLGKLHGYPDVLEFLSDRAECGQVFGRSHAEAAYLLQQAVVEANTNGEGLLKEWGYSYKNASTKAA